MSTVYALHYVDDCQDMVVETTSSIAETNERLEEIFHGDCFSDDTRWTVFTGGFEFASGDWDTDDLEIHA